jgi:release factor glutamine methyltransferase
MTTWGELVTAASGQITGADVRHIARECAGTAELAVARPTGMQRARFEQLVARRAAGEPLQYVLGRWGFRTLDLMVDRRVLIPRPETEVVAGLAIEAARRRRGARVLDLGTGSGAIALAVAAELDDPDLEVWGVDLSPDAIAVARANLAGLGRAGARVRLVEGDWFGGLDRRLEGTVDVVVANPPYIAAGEELPSEVADWEPTAALVAGPTGTEALAAIVEAAPGWLASDGVLVLETAPDQAAGVAALARRAGFARAVIHPDLSCRLRAVVAER